MTTGDLLHIRLVNQQIIDSKLKTPQQLVEWMAAMQAQEYAMAKWAIGLRLRGTTENVIEKAFNEGKILRTHLLRPTWHFVSPKDIRWMLELTAPRIHQVNGLMCRKLGLDEKLLRKSVRVFVKALEGGKHLTRNALKEKLAKNQISCEGYSLGHIMIYAELEGIVCSGPREGSQFTYALLDERVPAQKRLKRSEALAELSKRYFSSRGPATMQDFTTWSNLTVKDAREGVASLGKKLVKEHTNGKEYFLLPSGPEITEPLPSFLMPDYDEYGMSYKDRREIFDQDKYTASVSRGNPVFNRMIVLNGRIEGTWKRTFEKGKAVIETFPFSKLDKTKKTALEKAVGDYLAFVGNAQE